MTRKDFLKKCILFLGMLLFPGLWRRSTRPETKKDTPKEALYYRRADHLAG